MVSTVLCFACDRCFSDFVAQLGLDHEQNLEKMRLLSLVTLAAQNNIIPYSEIVETLVIEGSACALPRSARVTSSCSE